AADRAQQQALLPPRPVRPGHPRHALLPGPGHAQAVPREAGREAAARGLGALEGLLRLLPGHAAPGRGGAGGAHRRRAVLRGNQAPAERDGMKRRLRVSALAVCALAPLLARGAVAPQVLPAASPARPGRTLAARNVTGTPAHNEWNPRFSPD